MTPFPALILWNDAHGDATQQVYDLKDLAHAPLVMHTLGWVVKDDATGVTMFTERVDPGDGTVSWRGRGFIPRGMVLEVRKLGLPRKRTAPPPV